jgi:hypothetical protein
MKKLLLAAVMVGAFSLPAVAETISLTAFVDGIQVANASSADGTLDVSNQAFGSVFNLNSLTINAQSFLAFPDIFTTNTLNVNQSVGGTHQLVINVTANGLVGTGTTQGVLSAFSVTGLTGGWNAQEQTFINGNLLSDTGVFTATSDSAFETMNALLTDPYDAMVRYTINSVGTGRFNGGIDMALAPVPIPAVGAGLPGVIAGFGAIYAWGKKRARKKAGRRLYQLAAA